MSLEKNEVEVKCEDIKEQKIVIVMTNTGENKNRVGDLGIKIEGLTTAQAFYAALALFEQVIKRFDSTTAAEFVATKIRTVSDMMNMTEKVLKEKLGEKSGEKAE